MPTQRVRCHNATIELIQSIVCYMLLQCVGRPSRCIVMQSVTRHAISWHTPCRQRRRLLRSLYCLHDLFQMQRYKHFSLAMSAFCSLYYLDIYIY
jgi:hypothetical protein